MDADLRGIISRWGGGSDAAPEGATGATAPTSAEVGYSDRELDSLVERWSNPKLAAATEAEPRPEAAGPPTTGTQPRPEDEGFWRTTGSAAVRGLVTGALETQAGLRTATGTPIAQAAAIIPPEHQDEITQLLHQGVTEGWTNPKWWGAHIGYGAASSAPSLAAGGAGVIAGGAVGGPVGALAGGATGLGLGAMAQTIVPAYTRAKIAGLDDDAALERALEETGIAGAFGTAMGLAPGIGVFGRTAAGALKRPVAEALIQMGVIQPGIGVGQAATTATVQGRTLSPDEALTGYVDMVGVGGAWTGLHMGASHLIAPRGKAAPASDAAIVGAHAAATGTTPALASARDEPAPAFYSQVKRVIDEKGPESASGGQWLATLRNSPGVKEEELEWLKIPPYLADASGKVSKADLLAHVEENAIQVREITKEGDEVKGEYGGYTLPGPRENYREILLQWERPSEKARDARASAIERKVAAGLDMGEEATPTGTEIDFAHEAGHITDQERSHWFQVYGEEAGLRPSERFRGSHFTEPDVLAHVRATDRIDRDGRRTLFLEEVQSDWHQAGRRQQEQGELLANETTVPLAPFRTSWHELAFKRMLRYAADGGYERIAWTSGEQQVARYPSLDARQQRGMREFYDKMLPQVAGKWGKRLGIGGGETRIGGDLISLHENTSRVRPNTPVRYLDVTPAAASRIRMGLPLFARDRLEVSVDAISRLTEQVRDERVEQGWKAAGRQIGRATLTIAKDLQLKVPITIHLHPEGRDRGWMSRDERGYHIHLALEAHHSVPELYATAAHELGHVVMMEHFYEAPTRTKLGIEAAYMKWRRDNPPTESYGRVLQRRDNSVTNIYRHQGSMDFPMLSLTPERQRYWTSFEEWFAEQTARWATTEARPLSTVDGFFKGIARRIADTVQQFRSMTGLAGAPERVIRDWLNSFHDQAGPFAADTYADMMLRSQRASQRAFERDGTPEVQAVPENLSTSGARSLIGSLFSRGDEPSGWEAHAAGADRMNRFYEYMVSLPQLAKLNPHVRGLQYYNEVAKLMHKERMDVAGEAMATLRRWQGLHGKQSDALAGLIDDYMNMKYRTEKEVAEGTTRKPSVEEFAKLVRDNGVSDRGLSVFQQVVKDFDRMLDRYRDILRMEAARIRDPVQAALRYTDIESQIARMRKAPYFPAMRFGDRTITIRDAAGNVVHFETAESARKQNQVAEAMRAKLPEGHTLRTGVLAKDVVPLLGMPPGLLERMGDKLELSQTQRDALDQLRFELAPAQSFAHRFQYKDRTPGYSTDFKRAYANYFFHAGNHFTRVKYVDQLRDFIAQARTESRGMPDSVKRDQIANFMSDHLRNMIDPKPDFAILRSSIFHWALGFSPAAATINLSQTLLNTYPFLASKFGDAGALGAMGRAGTRLSTFYKKGTLTGETEGSLRAMGEAVREGVISESQAAALAGLADGRNLSKGFGGNAAERAFSTFSQMSSFLFEHTEQYNRRIAFRAAYELAIAHPEAEYVKQMVRENPLQFSRLKAQGWTDSEAGAFVAAKDAVEATQYIYAQFARPKFMRGRAGSLFVFKSFTQNTLFNLWNYPSAAARSLLIMGALGGAMGLPGVEDINGLLRGIAWQLFGKDFDLQDAARNFVLDVLGGRGERVKHPGDLTTDQGHIRPDILLHGLSRVGYGIPALADLMGNMVGQGHVPIPVSDRHQNIGMGNILPIEPGIALAPQITGMGAGKGNTSGQELREVQRASGAIFGLGFALYKALFASQYDMDEFKRWTGVVPAALRNAWSAMGYMGIDRPQDLVSGHRNPSPGLHAGSGATVVRFDPNEPEHMAEAIAKSMGYQPQRVSAYYDRVTAEREAQAYWDVRKEMLLRQAWAAKQSGDPETWERARGAIQKFNQDLPPEARAKAITGEALAKSFQTRAVATAKTEAGVPLATSAIPLSRSIQQMFPEAQVWEGRRVR